MKHAIYLLLAISLAISPLACSRDQTDDSVLAKTDENVQDNTAAVQADDSTTAARQEYQPRAPRPERDAPSTAPARPATPDRPDRVDREAADPERSAAPRPAPAATARVPAGATITVVMIDRVSTDHNVDGDTFSATLSEPLVVDGKVVAEKGDRVQGRLQSVEEAGKVKGRARMELVLTRLTTGNRTYNIETEPFVAVAEGSKAKDAATIGGGAGVGAAIGAIAGGKKGAAIGAIIGGGAGTTAVLVSKGEHMTIEPETRVNFVTSDSFSLPVIRRVIS